MPAGTRPRSGHGTAALGGCTVVLSGRRREARERHATVTPALTRPIFRRMWPLLAVLLQGATPAPCPSLRAIAEAEHARDAGLVTLVAGVSCADTARQRVAVRALGRLENPAAASAIAPLTRAPDPRVRQEAVNAMAQSRAPFDFAALLATERHAATRGTIYESIGRVTPTPAAAESILVAGLAEPHGHTRAGAARGLESLVRRTARSTPPAAATIAALRAAARDTTRGRTGTDIRELALLALVAAGDRDTAAYAAALRDSSEQVRRVAVAGLRRWEDDPSPIVRLQGLRSATCTRFVESLRDTSTHVALLAIDLIGERRCAEPVATTALEGEIGNTADWRRRAHATVALARVDATRAGAAIRALAASTVPQARAYAATAAKLVGDSATRARLARDPDPNVAIAALQGARDARWALGSRHAGLALAGIEALKGAPELPEAVPELLASLRRFTAMRMVTMRDARVAALQRLDELPVTNAMTTLLPALRGTLTPLLRDPDPAVAALAAKVLTAKGGTEARAITARYTPPPMPLAAYTARLAGATAEITVRGVGTMTVDLLLDEAPSAATTFAVLADNRRYDGLTFHRIVPNFVIQGGSPGADEYDPAIAHFMRDEVGLARNARGTFGISTRGRDTGDGQIYANLIDNYRLDHDYTVFARVVSGLDVMDRVQEGDVIESVRIRRRVRP